ncbi:molybdenum ABC transporter ATP-binding protein [Magnetovibrio blakemorei]|uniref:Molybdenum ABC transporter ATP-binding protein n=1 Tax=Magnetovibrio blakemorei TaxID=28181 RepID=A0A1E5Q8B3_9PROT|nr:molybdenum ABC transporter ATP-binding protein [Magnetovibrio blakemorei]OEJ66956.1 molybdenum ABC transporter ATP-binding protein [Magnetovibrio blakemorei]
MSSSIGIDAYFAGPIGDFKLKAAFHVPATGVTALFGPSGCGKTTVLRCLAGLMRMPGSSLRFNRDVWQFENRFVPPHKRPIGYVFQEASLFAHLSVRQNLLFGAKRAFKDSSAPAVVGVAFDELVDLLGIEALLARAPNKLSGGERQRVAIGRALLSRPKLLLMDEPLAALDTANKDEILPYLEKLHAHLAIPVVYVSHDMAEVERLADHMILMDQGRVHAAGPLDSLVADLTLPLAGSKQAAALLDARIEAYDTDYDLSHLSVPGGQLLIPGHLGLKGQRRRVQIAATDVSIALTHTTDSSINNVLAARIIDMKPITQSQLNVSLKLGHDGSGGRILSRVTRKSWDRLNLHINAHVYVQLKSLAMVGGVYEGAHVPEDKA